MRPPRKPHEAARLDAQTAAAHVIDITHVDFSGLGDVWRVGNSGHQDRAPNKCFQIVKHPLSTGVWSVRLPVTSGGGLPASFGYHRG